MDKLEKTLLTLMVVVGTMVGMSISQDFGLATLMLLGGLTVILVIRRAR